MKASFPNAGPIRTFLFEDDHRFFQTVAGFFETIAFSAAVAALVCIVALLVELVRWQHLGTDNDQNQLKNMDTNSAETTAPTADPAAKNLPDNEAPLEASLGPIISDEKYTLATLMGLPSAAQRNENSMDSPDLVVSHDADAGSGAVAAAASGSGHAGGFGGGGGGPSIPSVSAPKKAVEAAVSDDGRSAVLLAVGLAVIFCAHSFLAKARRVNEPKLG